MQRAWQTTQLLQPESRDRRYMNINDGPQSARQKKSRDPAGDERLDESSGRVVVERASDAAQLSNLKESFNTDRGDVLVNGQIGRQ